MPDFYLIPVFPLAFPCTYSECRVLELEIDFQSVDENQQKTSHFFSSEIKITTLKKSAKSTPGKQLQHSLFIYYKCKFQTQINSP